MSLPRTPAVPTANTRRGRRVNLADRVYAQLKADLFDFTLMPGDRLSENEIADRTQASRTPVREALFRLQRDGYVDVLDKGGWHVKPLDFHAFDELYDVRITLECAAVQRLCALAERPPALAGLDRTWQIEAHARETDSTTLWQLDEQFHATLVAAAGNGEMARIHRDVTERIRIVRRLDFVKPARVAATYDTFSVILDATEFLDEHGQGTRAQLKILTNFLALRGLARRASARPAPPLGGGRRPDRAHGSSKLPIRLRSSWAHILGTWAGDPVR